MSADETNEFSANESTDPTASYADLDAEPVPQSSWNRRTFLKAAALGAAAAAFVRPGTSVLAHNPTGVNCTAGDIEVLSATILNAPCTCSGGTFQGIAAVRVRNDNNATRYCITLHLSGSGQDVVLYNALKKDANGNTIVDTSSGSDISNFGERTMYGSLGSISCSQETLSFPSSIISFNPSANDPCPSGLEKKLNPAKCRRQDLTFVNFGATLSCADGCGSTAATGTSYCNVPCGGKLYLKATASGASEGATAGTYTFTLKDPNGNTVGNPITGSSPQCFTVEDPKAGAYTLTVTDSSGKCFRTSTSNVTVNELGTPTVSATNPTCAGGSSTLTASATGATNFTFSDITDSNAPIALGSSSTGTLTYNNPPSGTRTIQVVASNGTAACDKPATTTFTVPQLVTFNLEAPEQSNCSGGVTLKATASGGSGTYTYTFKVNGTQVQSGASNTLSLAAQLDGACRTVTVVVKDTNNCPGTVQQGGTDTRSFSQCVTTSTCTP